VSAGAIPRHLRRLAPALAALLALLLAPSGAAAFYGNGAQIISADFERLEQGDDSTVFAAISADGRYVAIQTRARNFFDDDDPDPPGQYRAGGVFRFDLQTKALDKVADGDLFEEAGNTFLRRGASNPSISADGRFIAFTTAEPLLAGDVNDNADVYVRDMAIPIGAPGAYDLVSARDGGDTPAEYGPAPGVPFPGSEPGADTTRGVSISADGRAVAFRTVVSSDLPAADAADVPPGQVYVRDRTADKTTLVTAIRDEGSSAMTELPAGGAVGAALSADGSTVAWTGANAAAQTRILGGENADPSFFYYLWRRIGDGSAAPTRRITGLADPDDPACPPGSTSFFDQTSTGPCYGPLTDQEGNRTGITSQVPALSGDGFTVAFLTGAGPRPLATTEPGLDLFVTEMRAGLSRKQATVELTRDTRIADLAAGPPLSSVAMSAGGRFLAITTVRTEFALPALQLLGDPRPVPGPRELYVVDLQARTLDRVARAYWGGDIDASVQNDATISADGTRVAFASLAGNLFFGDANQLSDAFVAERQPDQGAGPPPALHGPGGADATFEFGGGPQIGVRARSKAGGVIVLTVSVPAAGGVKAVARASAGTPRRVRTLAVAKGRAKGGTRSRIRLELRPVRRYRRELRTRGQIPGRVAVNYVASRGGRRAAASVAVVFRQSIARRNSRR
jgi:hypothetical protein